MPTPPKKGEKQKDFVSRCIPEVLKDKTASDQTQAAAICYSMYRESKKKSKEKLSTYENMCEKLKVIPYNGCKK
jgi:hypothetical protein